MPYATNELTQMRLMRAALRQSGTLQISVRGSSMLPALQPGARVTLVSQPFSSVQSGQVVAFACGQRLIVHRVIDRTLEHLVTLGDNLCLLDPPVTPEMYVGTIAGAQNDVLPRQTGVGRSIRPTQLDQEPELSLFGSVRVMVPKVTEALVPPWITLAVLPSGFEDSSRDSLCIGISPAGALSCDALPELLDMGVRCRRPPLILLGFDFGVSNPACNEPVLPPEITALHVRLGRPWQQFELGTALDVIRAQLDFWRYRKNSTVRPC